MCEIVHIHLPTKMVAKNDVMRDYVHTRWTKMFRDKMAWSSATMAAGDVAAINDK